MDEQLKVYIQQKLASGASVSEIRTELLNNNWEGEKIDALYRELGIGVENTETPSAPVAPINTTKAKKPVLINVAILFALLVFLTSSVAAGYFLLDAVFGNKAPYSEDNLVSGIVSSLQRMETFTYSVSASLEMEEREVEAKPFEFRSPSTLEEYKERYRRDYKRVGAISEILTQLKFVHDSAGKPLPRSLKELSEEQRSAGGSFSAHLTDPRTNEEYQYVVLREDFELMVTFETLEAVSAIKKSYQYDPLHTRVSEDGFTVTFTKESNRYVFLPSSLPKPYHEQLSDMLVYLPPEMYFKIGISAATDLTNEKPDIKIAIDGEGDFGDLVYKFAGDIMKKDEYWYLRIRNMPSLFSGFFAYEKGEWIRASTDWLEKNTGRSLIPVVPSMASSEKPEERYKDNRDELVRFATAVMRIADEEKVLLVKDEPIKEVVNDKKLYRYNLTFNGDTIVRFVERVSEEAQKYEATRNSDLVNDAALLEYLKSEEFKAVFDYYNESLILSLLVNPEGFIESVEYSIRAVPDDEVKQLANKQARFKVNIGFSDINKPVEIIAPEEFKEIEDIMNAQKDAYSRFGNSGNASIKQFLSNTRSTAELVYNTGGYSYAKVCDDERIISSMKSAQENYSKDGVEVRRNIPPKAGAVSCLSGSDWYVIQSPLVSSGEEIFEYWCVDSTGFSGGNINMLSISDKSCPQ